MVLPNTSLDLPGAGEGGELVDVIHESRHTSVGLGRGGQAERKRQGVRWILSRVGDLVLCLNQQLAKVLLRRLDRRHHSGTRPARQQHRHDAVKVGGEGGKHPIPPAQRPVTEVGPGSEVHRGLPLAGLLHHVEQVSDGDVARRALLLHQLDPCVPVTEVAVSHHQGLVGGAHHSGGPLAPLLLLALRLQLEQVESLPMDLVGEESNGPLDAVLDGVHLGLQHVVHPKAGDPVDDRHTLGRRPLLREVTKQTLGRILVGLDLWKHGAKLLGEQAPGRDHQVSDPPKQGDGHAEGAHDLRGAGISRQQTLHVCHGQTVRVAGVWW